MTELFKTYSPEKLQLDLASAYEVVLDRRSTEQMANQLIASRNILPSVEVGDQEYHDNARSALFEALTESGHLSRIEISGTLEEINQQVLSRLLNGYSENLMPHERQRRFYELCNELIIQQTHNMILTGVIDESVAVLEVSDYPESLSDDQAIRLGYRPYNKKGMVRSTHLCSNADGTYTRVIEQISRSNSSSDTTFNLLEDAYIDVEEDSYHDIVALKNPLVYKTNIFTEGVIDIQRRLDIYSGDGVIYGEHGTNELHIPYEQIRRISREREQRLEFFVNKLANFEQRLDRAFQGGYISEEERSSQYKNQALEIIRLICRLEPEYSAGCFGEAASKLYYRASMAEARGERQLMADLLEEAAKVEKAVIICGMAISQEKAKELGIDVESSDSMAEEAKSSWKWKKGVCVVKKCDSPKPTEIGPCSVCRRCQQKFDHPTISSIFGSIINKENAKEAA